VIRRLARRAWPAGTLYNVNFPPVPPQAVRGFAATRLGRREIGDNLSEIKDPRGRQYYWIGPGRSNGGAEPGSDFTALAEARVSITPIHLDLTNEAALAALREDFA